MMHIAILCFLVLSCRYEVHSLLSTHGNDVEQLKLLVQQMNVSLQHVLAENQKLNAEIDGLKNLTSRIAAISPGLHPVAFTAILTHNVELGAGQTVVFDKILLNLGNAYHETYGHFRAPVSGLYQFSVSLLNDHKETTFVIVRNGNQNLATLFTKADIFSSSSKMFVFQMEFDDVLFVRTVNAGNLDGTGRGSVAFTAVLSHDTELANERTVVFDKILVNRGNAYNKNVGHFRAPNSGVYQFTVSYLNNGKASYFLLEKNGNQALIVDYIEYGQYYSSSSSVVVQLNKEDIVFVKTIMNPSNLRGSDNCFFSGFLILKK